MIQDKGYLSDLQILYEWGQIICNIHWTCRLQLRMFINMENSFEVSWHQSRYPRPWRFSRNRARFKLDQKVSSKRINCTGETPLASAEVVLKSICYEDSTLRSEFRTMVVLPHSIGTPLLLPTCSEVFGSCARVGTMWELPVIVHWAIVLWQEAGRGQIVLLKANQRRSGAIYRLGRNEEEKVGFWSCYGNQDEW